MCMDRETISELGEAIGKVEEVETDANGDCMGEVIRLKSFDRHHKASNEDFGDQTRGYK